MLLPAPNVPYLSPALIRYRNELCSGVHFRERDFQVSTPVWPMVLLAEALQQEWDDLQQQLKQVKLFFSPTHPFSPSEEPFPAAATVCAAPSPCWSGAASSLSSPASVAVFPSSNGAAATTTSPPSLLAAPAVPFSDLLNAAAAVARPTIYTPQGPAPHASSGGVVESTARGNSSAALKSKKTGSALQGSSVGMLAAATTSGTHIAPSGGSHASTAQVQQHQRIQESAGLQDHVQKDQKHKRHSRAISSSDQRASSKTHRQLSSGMSEDSKQHNISKKVSSTQEGKKDTARSNSVKSSPALENAVHTALPSHAGIAPRDGKANSVAEQANLEVTAPRRRSIVVFSRRPAVPVQEGTKSEPSGAVRSISPPPPPAVEKHMSTTPAAPPTSSPTLPSAVAPQVQRGPHVCFCVPRSGTNGAQRLGNRSASATAHCCCCSFPPLKWRRSPAAASLYGKERPTEPHDVAKQMYQTTGQMHSYTTSPSQQQHPDDTRAQQRDRQQHQHLQLQQPLQRHTGCHHVGPSRSTFHPHESFTGNVHCSTGRHKQKISHLTSNTGEHHASPTLLGIATDESVQGPCHKSNNPRPCCARQSAFKAHFRSSCQVVTSKAFAAHAHTMPSRKATRTLAVACRTNGGNVWAACSRVGTHASTPQGALVLTLPEMQRYQRAAENSVNLRGSQMDTQKCFLDAIPRVAICADAKSHVGKEIATSDEANTGILVTNQMETPHAKSDIRGDTVAAGDVTGVRPFLSTKAEVKAATKDITEEKSTDRTVVPAIVTLQADPERQYASAPSTKPLKTVSAAEGGAAGDAAEFWTLAHGHTADEGKLAAAPMNTTCYATGGTTVLAAESTAIVAVDPVAAVDSRCAAISQEVLPQGRLLTSLLSPPSQSDSIAGPQAVETFSHQDSAMLKGAILEAESHYGNQEPAASCMQGSSGANASSVGKNSEEEASARAAGLQQNLSQGSAASARVMRGGEQVAGEITAESTTSLTTLLGHGSAGGTDTVTEEAVPTLEAAAAAVYEGSFSGAPKPHKVPAATVRDDMTSAQAVSDAALLGVGQNTEPSCVTMDANGVEAFVGARRSIPAVSTCAAGGQLPAHPATYCVKPPLTSVPSAVCGREPAGPMKAARSTWNVQQSTTAGLARPVHTIAAAVPVTSAKQLSLHHSSDIPQPPANNVNPRASPPCGASISLSNRQSSIMNSQGTWQQLYTLQLGVHAKQNREEHQKQQQAGPLEWPHSQPECTFQHHIDQGSAERDADGQVQAHTQHPARLPQSPLWVSQEQEIQRSGLPHEQSELQKSEQQHQLQFLWKNDPNAKYLLTHPQSFSSGARPAANNLPIPCPPNPFPHYLERSKTASLPPFPGSHVNDRTSRAVVNTAAPLGATPSLFSAVDSMPATVPGARLSVQAAVSPSVAICVPAAASSSYSAQVGRKAPL